MQDYLIIGQIVKPQGVKGQLKVKVLSEDANRFDNIKTVFMKNDNEYKAVNVLDASTRGEFAYIILEDISDRDAAEKCRNEFLYVDRENAIKLEPDRYFICDLIGTTVYTENGDKLGILKDILQTGTADIYCVEGERNFMFPAIKKLIDEFDLEAKRIIVNSDTLEEVAVYED